MLKAVDSRVKFSICFKGEGEKVGGHKSQEGRLKCLWNVDSFHTRKIGTNIYGEREKERGREREGYYT